MAKTKKRRLPQTFPHRVILVASLTLCLCALGGMVLAVISWYSRVWGYYFGTGFWCGGIILMTGIFGIVASYVRSACSVKTFMIFSIIGFVVSLAMIALSCGGLDRDSGFYDGFPKETVIHFICHGGYLGLGVLQTSICILTDAISIYYLFSERHAEIYSVKLRGKKQPLKRSRPKSKDSTRSSTASSAPLVGGSIKSRSDSRGSKKAKKALSNIAIDADETDMPIYRNRGSFVKSQNGLDSSTPISPCIRPASFTTFKHSGIFFERSSLVHPDDSINYVDTNRSPTSDTASSHYAQTMLFGPPLPIEEDEELPPYEVNLDLQGRNTESQNLQRNSATSVGTSSFKLRRTTSAPLHIKRRQDYKRSAHGKPQLEAIDTPNAKNGAPNEFAKYIIDRPDLSSRLSQSEDMLNDGPESHHSDLDQMGQSQGVQLRNFSRSNDKIAHPDRFLRNNRSQSVRTNRDTRLDRRQRALSAEFKHTKDNGIEYANELDPQRMAHPAYDSTSALYACTKTLPSKFSIRSRLSQKGPREAIPVQSLSSLPLFSPPPKPPRTHSVTLDELNENPSDINENAIVSKHAKETKPDTAQNSNLIEQTPGINILPKDKPVDTFDPRVMQTVYSVEKQGYSPAKNAPAPTLNTVTASVSNDVVKPDDDVFLPTSRETEQSSKKNIQDDVKIIKVEPKSVSVVPRDQFVHPSHDGVILLPDSNKNVPSHTLNAVPAAVSRIDDICLPTSQETEQSSNKNVQNDIKTVKVEQKTVSVEPRDQFVQPLHDGVILKPNREKRDTENFNQTQQTTDTARVTLDSGPVLRVKIPSNHNTTISEPSNLSKSGDIKETSRNNSSSTNMDNSMTLPVSPVIKPPFIKDDKVIETRVKSDPLYAKVDKKPPVILPKPQVFRLPPGVTKTAGGSNVSVAHKPSAVQAKNAEILADNRTRQAPLSPSEKILQRQNDRPIINATGVSNWDTNFRTNDVGRNLFLPSAENTGARPKTTLFRRSNSEDPDDRPIRPFVREDPRNASNITRGRPASYSHTRVYPSENTSPLPKRYQPKFSFAYPTSPTSAASPTSNRNSFSYIQSRTVQSNQSAKTVTPSTGSAKSVQNGTNHVTVPSQPVSTTSTGSVSSQGVLHLAQPQYQHQVADSRGGNLNGSAGVGNNLSPPPPPVPMAQQNNEQQEDEEKPLFSVVL